MKRFALLFALFVVVVSTAVAQRTVSGTILDDAGDALIGANVVVKGTTVGTVTDIDGTYALQVPDGYSTLVITYTGYDTQEIEMGVSNVLDVTMSAGVQLSEVVVTGLGIKKEKKALGYGVSTISNEAIANRAEADVTRILRGKATGVDITQTSGLAGSGTSVIIRGYSSITGSNQPLFVVDGVPFNTNTNSDRDNFASGSSTASSRFLDLDPNNIAEINILKGLSATVLYGEAGRNGVVLITTKTGDIGADADKKMEISVSQSLSFTEVSNIPDYQNTYGNGFSGNFGWFFSNWGPSFDVRDQNGIDAQGQIEHPYDQEQYNDDFPEFIGQRYNYQPYETVENFFTTGTVSNTSLSLSKSFGDAAVSANYSYLSDEGFVQSNTFDKHNLGLGATANLSNGIRLKSTFNFMTSDRKSPPASAAYGSGSNDGTSSLFSDVLYTPRSIDLLNLPYQSPLDGSMVYYRRGSSIQNPLWTLNNSFEDENIDRFFGTIDVQYDLTSWLTAQYRIGIDQYTQKQEITENKGGANIPDGLFITSDRANNITDQVVNLMYNFQLTDDLSLDGLVGTNFRKETNNYDFTRSTQQLNFGLFTHNSFIETEAFTFKTVENNIGAYATATLGYKNFLYVGFQGRNDWTSTLEKDNRSIFYPSGSLSFIPSEAFDLSGGIVDYLKLRVGYGTSAGYPDPYQTRNSLAVGAREFVTSSGTIANTNSISDRLGNLDLQPEKISEIEFGIEANFLSNRLGIDLSVYDKQSSDLIIDLDLDPSTGYRNTTINAAEVTNRGIELGLNISPFKGDFGWNLGLNFTKNENIVDAIADGVDQVVIAGFTNLGNFAIPGESFGVIQGSAYEKNANGELLVNTLGEYIATNDIEIIGDPVPNYNANIINTFSWKDLAFNVHFNYVDGGDIYSVTTATMLARGNTVDTDFDRFLPLILPGVLASDEATPNNIQIYMGDAFFSGYFGGEEGSIFDGTTIRLREISMSYALPKRLLDKTPFGNLSLKVFGENMWYRAVNFPEGVNFDPEVLSLGVGNGRGFDFLTGPTAKKYGIAINATF